MSPKRLLGAVTATCGLLYYAWHLMQGGAASRLVGRHRRHRGSDGDLAFALTYGQARNPARQKGENAMMYSLARLIIMTLLLILIGAGHSFADDKKQKNSDIDNIGNRNINKGSINFTSLEKEIELGRKMAADIERQAKLLQDPAVNEYVNRIGQNLVRNSDAKVPFTIKIIESEDVNAFALPGGFFFVNTGLILAADDEAELAGVMAHEIAHVAARHGTENASKSQLLDFATIPLIFLGGPAGFGLRQAAGILVPMQFLKFSRKAETEADYLGVQYMYKTGYDPSAAVTFFEKLQAREKAKPGAMSSVNVLQVHAEEVVEFVISARVLVGAEPPVPIAAFRCIERAISVRSLL